MPHDGSSRLPAFDAHLKGAGIPISGLSQSGPAPAGVTIGYLPEATAEQVAFAENEKATFDWRRRRPLSRNTIATAVAALTAQQQNAILRHVVCMILRERINDGANISAVLGVAVPLDEVDPDQTDPS
jgi:hypothetical protein